MGKARSYGHRLHYRWSQLEGDRWPTKEGSPCQPCSKANRTLELEPGTEYSRWPTVSSECPFEQAKFSACEHVYKVFDYNTFVKNGCLKLTEVELFFLSSNMTRQSAGEWLVVYLGIGNGERFRYLRDEFFPDLSVIAFDPLDTFYTGNRDHVVKNAQIWKDDGTNYIFHLRCFDIENDVAMIREKAGGKKLLLISDIRGVALLEDGAKFDKAQDQDLQLQFIQQLHPVRSLVKFVTPDAWSQFYDYAPGVILKQIFTFFGSCELRLMIDGAPQQSKRYNTWELYEKMMFHHDNLRGQVYETTRGSDCTSCLDCCFDCTVLWDTVSTYAAKNHVDPNDTLSKIINYHIYDPTEDTWRSNAGENHEGPTWSQRWWDVESALIRGNLMEAVAILEAEDDANDTDWADIAQGISADQPFLAERVKRSLRRPASREALLELLGSLAEPFTPIKTDMNSLLD
mmetsp:Transcript_124524/g.277828  ORF Transcript_124524/g.277828 Transcript_124524/m.277828 type:complete len:457 (-) Transcript_124524:62-1432(-)